MTPPRRTGLSTIDEVIADAKAGKLFILVDDEDRENEGDLCVIGEYATAESINFMAKYGRGLICLALTRIRTEQLGLTMMERRHSSWRAAKPSADSWHCHGVLRGCCHSWCARIGGAMAWHWTGAVRGACLGIWSGSGSSP